MRTINIITYLLAATITTAASAFEAHEWGTFTSLVGSDGRTQNGMYHEDEPLPNFVYQFGETRDDNNRPPPQPCHSKGCFGMDTIESNVITQKMETPVIYFYLGANEQATKVNVNVRFPEGVVTESYPGPISTSPKRSDNLVLANGNTTFDVEILLATFSFRMPEVDFLSIYQHARNVGSNVVRSGKEEEKFIFYRGLGRFQPRVQISSSGRDLSINFTSMVQAMYLVNVSPEGVATGVPINTSGLQFINASTIEALRNQPSRQDIMSQTMLREELILSLVYSGLRKDEAKAMLDTWENGYLKVPGLRLLYILPQFEVDDVLPLTMTPAPDKLVRSFVARIEVMLDMEERDLVKQIDTEGTAFKFANLGRFAEPKLRRAREVAQGMTKLKAETRPLIDSLILQASQAPSAPGGVQ